VGVLIRAGLSEWADTPAGHWPWATLAVNVVAAFMLGFFVARPHPIARMNGSSYLPALLGPGLCGALSTFSTLQIELLEMLDADRIGLAALYAGVTLLLGFGAVRAARLIVLRTGATT
jgi:fluoride exporter